MTRRSLQKNSNPSSPLLGLEAHFNSRHPSLQMVFSRGNDQPARITIPRFDSTTKQDSNLQETFQSSKETSLGTHAAKNERKAPIQDLRTCRMGGKTIRFTEVWAQ